MDLAIPHLNFLPGTWSEQACYAGWGCRTDLRVCYQYRGQSRKRSGTAVCTASGEKTGAAFRRLAGFAKTKLLQPGECQELKLTINGRELASFDMENASWICEEGEYRLLQEIHWKTAWRFPAGRLDEEVTLYQSRNYMATSGRIWATYSFQKQEERDLSEWKKYQNDRSGRIFIPGEAGLEGKRKRCRSDCKSK